MGEVFSIEIREGVYVRFHGIPWDLTEAEAAKLGAVMVALGTRTDEHEPEDRAA